MGVLRLRMRRRITLFFQGNPQERDLTDGYAGDYYLLAYTIQYKNAVAYGTVLKNTTWDESSWFSVVIIIYTVIKMWNAVIRGKSYIIIIHCYTTVVQVWDLLLYVTTTDSSDLWSRGCSKPLQVWDFLFHVGL